MDTNQTVRSVINFSFYDSVQYVDHMTVMWPADTGFEIPNEFVVGYALDYNEYFRDLNVSYAMTSNNSLSHAKHFMALVLN